MSTSSTDTNEPVIAATIMLGKGKVTVLAEATDVPGLVITPEIDDQFGFTGRYTVTHTESGLRVLMDRVGVDLYTARRIVTELGTTAVDWTLPRETIVEQFRDHRADINAAIKKGRWTYTGDDVTDPDQPLPVGQYPRNAAEATSAAMMGAVLRDALQRAKDTWSLISYDRSDTAARDANLRNLIQMLADYGFVSVLRQLRQIEPAAADAAARDVWQAFDAGDSIHDELAEWGAELGLPYPEDISAEAAQVVAERDARRKTPSSDTAADTQHTTGPEQSPPATTA